MGQSPIPSRARVPDLYFFGRKLHPVVALVATLLLACVCCPATLFTSTLAVPTRTPTLEPTAPRLPTATLPRVTTRTQVPPSPIATLTPMVMPTSPSRAQTQAATQARTVSATAPSRSVATSVPTAAKLPPTKPPATSPAVRSGNCDPAYPDVCIPSPPPDLSCAKVAPLKRFRVLPPDPHGFDGDRDGIGCE